MFQTSKARDVPETGPEESLVLTVKSPARFARIPEARKGVEKMPQLKALFCAAALGLSLTAFAADGQFLADRHVAKGVKCESCHKAGPNAAPKKADCLACHGGTYAKLAEKTDKLEVNPHDSHQGEIECSKCHKGHKPAVLECARCHDFSKELHIH